MFAQLIFALALALLLLPGDVFGGPTTGRRRGNKDRGRKDKDGTGYFMGGLYRDGSRAGAKSSLHFVFQSAGCFGDDRSLFFFNHSFQNGMNASGQL